MCRHKIQLTKSPRVWIIDKSVEKNLILKLYNFLNFLNDSYKHFVSKKFQKLNA